MDAPAVFKGTYADWKLIKTRGVVQIVLEVPLSSSGQAYDVLGGMPNAAKEIWCAVALLKPEGGDQTDSSHGSLDTSPRQETKTGGARSWSALHLAQQAGIACNDPIFGAFLKESEGFQIDNVASAEDVASAVKKFCHVETRSSIVRGTPHGDRWNVLYARFVSWKAADRVAS